MVKGAGGRLKQKLQKSESAEIKLSPDELVWKEKVKDTSVWTLKAGLQDLTDALVEKLEADPRVEIRLNTRVAAINASASSASSTSSSPGGRLRLATSQRDGSSDSVALLDADHVISSVYAKELADALTATAPNDSWRPDVVDLASSLRKIPAVSVCVVNLEYLGTVYIFYSLN